jgi:small subunit ribosomal protein S16
VAVRLRLQRTGRRNRPCYRIAAMDSRTKRDGRCLEILGSYDPLASGKAVELVVKTERVKHWLSKGAKPTEKVAALLARSGIEAKAK